MNRQGQPPTPNNRSHTFSNVISSSVNRNPVQQMSPVSANGRGKTPAPIWGFNNMQQQQQQQQAAQAQAIAQQQATARPNPTYASLSSNSQLISAGLDMSEFPPLSQAKQTYSGVSGGSPYASVGAQYARSNTQSPLPMAPRTAPPGLAPHNMSPLEHQQQQILLQHQQQLQQQQDMLHGEHDDKTWPDEPMQMRNGFASKRPDTEATDDHAQDTAGLRQPTGDIWQFSSNQTTPGTTNTNTSFMNEPSIGRGLELVDNQDVGSLKKAEEMPFGLSGLLDFMKQDNNTDLGLLALGSDLTTLGLNLNQSDTEPLSATFGSPWAETSTTRVEPDFHLPACYHVQSAPPQQTKVANFKDETLFYIFYSMPRDLMQEAAAAELTNRHWRYHKELKVWLTKDINSEPIQSTPHYERGVYTFFDPTAWERVKKEYVLYYKAIA
ncbi:hypothetical protein V1512DRAFT_258444 [Lipomyces arxii]|uniref:uncharacterized protein n=1 Tax=Lipomyces arxii TaxID=56418 RepID=UPI0034CDF7FA